MSSIHLDIITRNLVETLSNLEHLQKDGFTDFLAEILYDVFDAVKEVAAEVIETGEPSAEIPDNIGGYAVKKSKGEPLYSFDRGIIIEGYGGISHGLGILTGDLHKGVLNQPLGSVSITRGKEVRIGTNFTEPVYIGDVHDGKSGITIARPFMNIASRRIEDVLKEAVERKLKELEIVSPPPQFISSLIVKNVLGDINVY